MGSTTVDALLLFGRFALQPGRQLLLEEGRPVPLGSRSLALLIALVERAGEVVSREELEAQVWPRTKVEETSLRVHVSRLRKALRDGQGNARYVVNVPGRGYVFVAPVVSAHRPTPDPADAREAIAAVMRNLEALLGFEPVPFIRST